MTITLARYDIKDMDLVELKQIQTKDFVRHPWEKARMKILEFFLNRKIPGARLIVDIGSGDGYIASELAKKYPDSTIMAIDSNYDEAFLSTHHYDRPNLRFNRGPSTFSPSVQEKADLVLLMDVLEHIENPWEFLKGTKGWQMSGCRTTYFITVPAFQSLYSQHDVYLGHCRRYKARELKESVEKAGFVIEEFGYFFFSLLLIRAVQKIREKIFRPADKQGLSYWRGGAFITSLIISFLWMDFKISRIFLKAGIRLPGLSCYCLCHPLPS